MALSTQELQSETGEADRLTYSMFRESSSVALQTSVTDLEGLNVVIMVRRLAAQEHSFALAQLASHISAIMKFGFGADDDPFLKVEVQSASASQKQISCLNLAMHVDRSVAAVLAVLICSPMAARLSCDDAVDSVWQHKQMDRSGLEHVTDRVAVNVRSEDQHLLHCARGNSREREDPSRTQQTKEKRSRLETRQAAVVSQETDSAKAIENAQAD